MSDKVQKIIRRDVMPDGTKIQLEDWKECYPSVEKTLTIGAYPIAKEGGNWIRKNETFRLTISRLFGSDKEVKYIYQGLIDGKIKLEDLSEHYYNGDKDKLYMGLA